MIPAVNRLGALRREHLSARAASFVLATRPAFLSVSLVAVFLGLALAAWAGAQLALVLALATALAALLVHASVNVLNDYYDALSGTDAINTGRVFPFTGGSRMIQNGVFTAAGMRQFGLLLLLAAALLGLVLAAASGPGLLLIGLAGIAVGWGYSAPPLQLAGRGLGEAAVALGIGSLIPLGTYYVQTGTFSWLPLAVASPYALLVADLLFINQFPDLRADAACDKRHWVVRLGSARARWLYGCIAAAAYCILLLHLAMGLLPRLAAIAMLPLPLSLRAAVLLCRFHDRPGQLRPAIIMSILAALGHGLLLALALAVAG